MKPLFTMKSTWREISSSPIGGRKEKVSKNLLFTGVQTCIWRTLQPLLTTRLLKEAERAAGRCSEALVGAAGTTTFEDIIAAAMAAV